MINENLFKEFLVYELRPGKSDISLESTKEILHLRIDNINNINDDKFIDADFQVYNEWNDIEGWGSYYDYNKYMKFIKMRREEKLKRILKCQD